MTRRRRRPAALLLIALLPLVTGALAACSDDDGDGDSGSRGPSVGTAVEGQDWRLPFEDDDVTVCGDVAVWGPVGETPAIVHADGSVTELEPEVPDDTEVELSDSANARARCLRDDAGEPVVVVELQERYTDPDDAPPTLLTGFDADGTQLWTYDALFDALPQYTGAGALVLKDTADDRYVYLDAATGEELGSETPEGLTIIDPVPVSSSVIVGGGAMRTLDGAVLVEGSNPAPVDPRRTLVEVDGGVGLVDLESEQIVWTAPGFTLPLEAAAVDLSTETATLVGEDGALHGLDLATGEERWVSDAEVELFGVGSVGQGVAVLPDEEFTTQVLVDTETGEVLPEREDDYVIAGNDLLLVVGDDGTPAIADVDDLR